LTKPSANQLNFSRSGLAFAGGTNLTYTSRDDGKAFAYHDLQGPNINVWRARATGRRGRGSIPSTATS
jgi:hypothetical protein